MTISLAMITHVQGDFIWGNHFWNSAYPGSTNWARKNLWALPRPRVSFRRWGDCKHCTPQNLSLASQIRENVEKKVSFHLPLFLGCGCILLEALVQSKLKGDFYFYFPLLWIASLQKLFVDNDCHVKSGVLEWESQQKHHLEAKLFFSTQPLYFWSNKCYERNAIFSKYNKMSKCFCNHYHEII